MSRGSLCHLPQSCLQPLGLLELNCAYPGPRLLQPGPLSSPTPISMVIFSVITMSAEYDLLTASQTLWSPPGLASSWSSPCPLIGLGERMLPLVHLSVRNTKPRMKLTFRTGSGKCQILIDTLPHKWPHLKGYGNVLGPNSLSSI